jgi:hypothetical protein
MKSAALLVEMEANPFPVAPEDVPPALQALADKAVSARRDQGDESEMLGEKLKALGYAE